jgi:hypothetical protein
MFFLSNIFPTFSEESKVKIINKGNVTRIETEGNLEITHKLDCIKVEEIKNTYTPADLYPAAMKCFSEGKYEQGSVIYGLAGLYGRFDIYRVTDKTAHQAVKMLIISNTQNLPQKTKLTWKAYFDKSIKQTITKVCVIAKKLGYPTYYPRYMIQHGMKTLIGTTEPPIVADFNPEEAWQNSLDKYLHCEKTE